MMLRNFISTDANEIIKWIENEREFRLWSADRYDKYPITSDDINNNYIKCMKNKKFYPLTLIDDNNIIGHLILRNPHDDLTEFRLGFIIINPIFRKKGYGKKLIQEAIDFAKKEYGAKNFNLGVFIDNDSAIKCYTSVGFEAIKIDKNAYKFQNESWDCAEMVYKGH